LGEELGFSGFEVTLRFLGVPMSLAAAFGGSIGGAFVDAGCLTWGDFFG